MRLLSDLSLSAFLLYSDADETLNINLLTGTLPSYLTCTRASTGTDIIDGVLTSFASNIARCSNANGLLVEPARTNLSLYANTATQSGTTVASGESDPLAGTAAYLVTESPSGSGATQWKDGTNTISFTSAATYTVSAFFKAGTCDRVQMFMPSAVDSGVTAYANFYLNGAGSVSANGAGALRAGIKALNNGWYRCWFSFASTATASSNMLFSHLSTGSEGRAPTFTRSGRTSYFYGSQCEAGATISSYIPTTVAAITRAADTLSFNFTALPPPYSIMASYTAPEWASSVLGGRVCEAVLSSSMGSRATFGRVTDDTRLSTQYQIGYATVADLFATGAIVSLTSAKTAMAVNTNDFEAVTNGGASATDALGATANIDRMYVGNDQISTSQFMGYVKEVKIFNTRKTLAELQAMTT
jgi:hypothetical protein